MVPHRAWFLAAVTLVTATLAAEPSHAVPVFPRGGEPAATTVIPAQGYCGRQNFLCRRRYGNGRRYRQCMAQTGCAVNRGGNRCQARVRFCSRRFPPGSPRFQGCVRRGGC